MNDASTRVPSAPTEIVGSLAPTAPYAASQTQAQERPASRESSRPKVVRSANTSLRAPGPATK
ncbi:MAG: hypothetical protein IPN17_22650 [Deltaproteobacteria bacterium]|nr:hypothetical protein [Deltaproteobacteria bacterium]